MSMVRRFLAMAAVVGAAPGACNVHGNGDTGVFDSQGPGSSESGAADSGDTTGADASGPGTSGGTTQDDSAGDAKFDLMPGDLGGGPADESTCAAVEQALSSAGCLFAPLIGGSLPDYPWAVVAANAGTNPANVTLRSKDGAVLEAAVVGPGETHAFVLGAQSQALLDHRSKETTQITKTAMLLESDIPIVAYEFNPFSVSENASVDASLLLPVHVWDDSYVVALYKNDGQPWILVTSLEDDNQVTITPPSYFTGETVGAAGLVPFVAGQPQQVTLNAQEILKIKEAGAGNTDFTGFRVESTKPVAVTVGAPTMSIPGPNSLDFRDYLEEQVPPLSALGMTYVAAKFHPRAGEPDVYRFVASEDGTTITLSGGVTDVLSLDAGEFADVLTPESFFAEGDKPFLAEHLMASQQMTVGPKDDTEFPGPGQSNNCWDDLGTTSVGDPAITFLTPVDQFRYRYTFLTPDNFAWDFLTVVALEDEWDAVELDGAPLPVGPTPIGTSGYAYASFMIGDGSHVIDSGTAVGIEVYGYDCVVSYAYAGGLNLNKINPEG